MIKGLIFDLDQTIINSSIAEGYRKSREWQKVYSLIPSFKLYDGFQEVFNFIIDNKIRCCIVTTSPGVYASKVMSHFGIPSEFIVDYFSTKNKKPHPEPMLKALQLLNLTNVDVISFGDRDIDIISSNSAIIKSTACFWGTSDQKSLQNSGPTYSIYHPKDIISLLGE